MRIIIAEDSPMYLELVARACRDSGHEVVRETASGVLAIRFCEELHPDVLLLDLRLSELNGFEVIEFIKARELRPKIIIISSYTSDYYLFRVEHASISGYIDKNTQTTTAIGDALSAVAAGKTWYSPSYTTARVNRISDPCFFTKILTNREREILGLIGEGLTDEEIAAQLGIAARTAQTHRSNIMMKLGIYSMQKLVVFSREKGLTPFFH